MSGDDGIIDLNKARERLRGRRLPPRRRPYAHATGPDEVEIALHAEAPDLLVSASGARVLARWLARAAGDAARLAEEPCRACDRRGCLRWHTGQIVRGQRRGELVDAVVVRVCRTTVRLEGDSGAWYVRLGSRDWRLVGWHRGV